MSDFVLPSLGADMETGMITDWYPAPGGHVARGDVVGVVETAKGAIDLEIWVDGTIGPLLVEQNVPVRVGTVLAQVTEMVGGAAAPTGTPAPAVAATAPVAAAAAASGGRRRISPAARKQAKDWGIDLDAVIGTGPEGAVTMADIERAHREGPAVSGMHAEISTLPPPPTMVEAVETMPIPQPVDIRSAIAAAMSRSKREIPHYYLAESIPMGAAMDWLTATNAGRPITERLLPAVLLIKAVAVALAEFPELNGFYREGVYTPSDAVHIGMAISLRQGGLIAPAIHDVADKGLDQLMRDLTDLVRRVRSGSVRSSEFTDPTITVTNLGDQGVEQVFGVIYPPQVALVGFGRVDRRLWVTGDSVAITPVVTATLSADHRVSDGGRGARFLRALSDLLQRPEELDAPVGRSSS
ncbi:MAG TPA: dihydrolipoamide acetyltransferase family protein [Propionibacteriaceae bacterium]|nr:dihydrolipoamide acetyltransferase family protein [Propionibacteriaceae bacterium]